MRPLPGGDASSSIVKPRSRKSSIDHPAVASSHVPTTFFMRREEDMDQDPEASSNKEPASNQRDSTYGVQSLPDALEAAFGAQSASADIPKETSHNAVGQDKKTSRSASHSSSAGSKQVIESSPTSPARKLRRKLSNTFSNTALPPPSADMLSPIPALAMASTPSAISLASLKLSDAESATDEVASQAIVSSGEEDGEEEDEGEGDVETQPDTSNSFPQLVMPSIQMPARRPFTTKGKAMGKLKILVAGEAGIGKTSLIRSIVQVCEDIVHVDPLSPSTSVIQPPPPKSRSRSTKSHSVGTARITEIHASTKPYPHWWTEPEESRTVRRRQSSNDSVLERNITFVDTPGLTKGNGGKEDMNLVIDHVVSLYHQMLSLPTMDDSHLLNIASGCGGISVDLVIYMLPPSRDISDDIDFMQRLSSLTNVIPVIAKADTLSSEDIVALKTSLLARLQTTPIKPFLFGKSLEDALLATQGLSLLRGAHTSSEPREYPFSTPTYPFAISSTPGPDNETMDASLLMSPDYVQPLLPSELTTLISQVFEPESIAWLRHSAAKKFLAWRRRTKLSGDPFMLQSLQQVRGPASAAIGINASPTSSLFSVASPSGVLVPHSSSSFYTSNLQSPFLASSPSIAHSDLEDPTSFSLARYNNSGHTEQPLSEIRIAKWATDLQRSLRNERDRFEELKRSDRARWLLERVGEEVSHGNIIASPGGTPRAEWAVVRQGDEKRPNRAGQRYGKAGGLDSRDPLGLCNFSDEVKRRSYVLFKVLGGVSVLGAVVVAVVRAFGIESGLPQNGWWRWVTGGSE